MSISPCTLCLVYISRAVLFVQFFDLNIGLVNHKRVLIFSKQKKLQQSHKKVVGLPRHKKWTITYHLHAVEGKPWFTQATSAFDIDHWIMVILAIHFVTLTPLFKPVFAKPSPFKTHFCLSMCKPTRLQASSYKFSSFKELKLVHISTSFQSDPYSLMRLDSLAITTCW
jgi:hypothetical protein